MGKLFIILLLSFTSEINANKQSSQLIYGKDDRYETKDYPDQQIQDLGKAVAAKLSVRNLIENPNDMTTFLFPKITLEEQFPGVCPDERFIKQYSIASCSGFLVAENKLVTAGHCMLESNDCTNHKWVFDYYDGIEKINKQQVYSCKKVIAHAYEYSKYKIEDFAVIELDRTVKDRAPLKFRKYGRALVDTPVITIGHPMGLPQKIDDGAMISHLNDQEKKTPISSFFLKRNYFTANLDSYAGNSGSPVINKNTLKVEGILVQGADDFVYNEERGCMQSNHLSDSPLNTYEKVIRITKVWGIL